MSVLLILIKDILYIVFFLSKKNFRILIHSLSFWSKVFLLNLVRKLWRTDKSNIFLRLMPPVQLLPQTLPVTSVWPGDQIHNICAAPRAFYHYHSMSFKLTTTHLIFNPFYFSLILIHLLQKMSFSSFPFSSFPPSFLYLSESDLHFFLAFFALFFSLLFLLLPCSCLIFTSVSVL